MANADQNSISLQMDEIQFYVKIKRIMDSYGSTYRLYASIKVLSNSHFKM
jgi:hypothetical protein